LVCGSSIIIIIIARLRGVHDGALLSSLYCRISLFLSSVVVMLMGCVLYLPYLCIRFRRGSGALVRLLLPLLLLLLWTATGSPPGVFLFSASLLSALSSLSLFLFLSLRGHGGDAP
jgi:hypothetical protein